MGEVTDLTFITSSQSNEWYTPPIYINAARKVMGSIDVDPASCAKANEIVKATRFYSKEDNGLFKPWRGKIFLNPPYGSIVYRRKRYNSVDMWLKKLYSELVKGDLDRAIVLVNACTDTQWFQRLWDHPICFVKGRIKFIPGEGASRRNQPTKANCFVYVASDCETGYGDFRETFKEFGHISMP